MRYIVKKEDSVRYIINEEKRIVVALMEKCQWDLIQYLNQKIPNADFLISGLSSYSGKTLNIGDTYRGIAKCSPEDVFDEEIGKELASKRAKEKYERAKSRVLENVAGMFIHNLQNAIFEQKETATSTLAELQSLENSLNQTA